jgi:tetratricopeptide (TPR) repeat protein
MKGHASRVLAALTPAALILIILLSAGCSGKVENLRRRVESELTSRLPRPEFVPTPLPYDDTRPAGPILPAPRATLRPIEAAMPDVPRPATGAGFAAPPTAAPGPTAAVTPGLPRRPVVPTITPATISTTLPARRPAPTRAAASSAADLPPAAQLSGVTHIWQTWNNCGPATLAMYLSFFGQKVKQEEVGARLRPDPDDKNVNLEEMAAYARGRGLSATVRANGDATRLRRLIAAGAPVLIETWYQDRPNDGMGHYRLLVGYDDATGHWIAYDSYDARDLVKGQPYAGIRLPYEEVERLWAVFNRLYLVIYDTSHAPAILPILNEDVDEATLWARALAHAQAETQARPDDPYAWFNLGSNLVALGRAREAGQAYDRARRIGLPWRMLWYQFGPYQAYYETGRYDEVIALANASIATARQTEEAYYWRGLAQKAKGDTNAARTSWQRAVELNPHYADAATALAELNTR